VLLRPLPRRPLRTGHSLTVLGFGGLQVGDYFIQIPESVAGAAIAAAWDAGIRYFDTAPKYGRGLSEHRLGGVLRNHPREDFVLSTKVGRRLVPDDELSGLHDHRGLPFRFVPDLSYEGTRRGIEESLHRLGLSRIDLALIHELEPRVYGLDYPDRFREALDGCYRALADLRAQGAIGAIGAGMNDAEASVRLINAADLDCLMLAGRYTLLEQGVLDDVLPLAEERGIGIVIGAPFNSGVLATGAVAEARYNNRPLEPQLSERVRALEAVCEAHRVPLAAAALQFPLAHPAVVSVVAGMGSAAEVGRNVGLVLDQIPLSFWSALKEGGLIRRDAPTPQDSSDRIVT
jgi:D-threo-aldose 1-dehydrogenase